MKIRVDPASKQDRDVIWNLLQYYLHDFSEFDGTETDENGLYDYRYLDFYWHDPDRFPFLIRAEKSIAGFALVRGENDPDTDTMVMEIAEFFVLRVFRQQGIGNKAAVQLWDMFPGEWRVRVLVENKPAYPFWQNAISDYTEGSFQVSQSAAVFGAHFTFSFNNSPKVASGNG